MELNDFTLNEPPLRGYRTEVYEGVNDRGERHAFKRVATPTSDDAQALTMQLRREVNLQAALSGPHFVKAYGAFQYEIKHMNRMEELVSEEHYAVLEMEWLEGMDLQRLCRRMGGSIPNGDLLQVAYQVAEALAEAHRLGILHGDVRPSNIFLTLDGRILLTDFGMARVRECQTVTHPADEALDYCGPMAFAPLEQMVGAKLAPTADVFSFGRTLEYFLNALPNDRLKAIIEKCTQPDPASRYASMDEVMGDLPVIAQSSNPLPLQKKVQAFWAQDHPEPKPEAETKPEAGPKPEPKPKKVCPKCGNPCAAGDAFCTECGASLSDRAPQPPIPAGHTWMCKRCHGRWTDPSTEGSTNFCPMCGYDHFVRIG